MVNGVILSKFDEQIDLIENIFKKYYSKSINSIQNLIELNKFSEPIKDISKIKNIYTFHYRDYSISSICILKDKRLVSGGNNDLTVYNRSYQPQFHILNAHDSNISSLCALRNGELASSGGREIKVWKINEDDYQLIHTLTEHTDRVIKVIQLKNDKLCSCSLDKTIKIWDNYKCIRTLTGHTWSLISIIEMNNFIISVPCDSNEKQMSQKLPDDGLRIWNESTYRCIKFIKFIDDDRCLSNNGISKLNDKTLLLARINGIIAVDIESSKIKKFNKTDFSLTLNVLKNGLVLVGNILGEVVCYDSLSNEPILIKGFSNLQMTCIIESEDNKIILCSLDKTINIYN